VSPIRPTVTVVGRRQHPEHYGAGRSEAKQCCGDPVLVVGAGNSAGQAVMHLANAGARVTMVVRGDDLRRSMSDYLVKRIAEHSLIAVRLRTQVEAVEAEGGQLAAVTIGDAGGKRERIPVTSLFLCIGGVPRSGWAAGVRDPLALETSVPGLFAAGDVRSGSTKRVAGAVGEGSMAVALTHRRLDELERIA